MWDGKFFDLYGKPKAGNFIYPCIFTFAADRGQSDLSTCGWGLRRSSIHLGACRVTIGGNLMGIVGMLVFIPMVSVFYTIFREVVYLRLKKRHL